jgi:hypothetical protein
MDYKREIDFEGDPKSAIEVAKIIFLQSGYEITDVSDTSISAEHKGGFLQTQSGNSIYGASPVTVSVKIARLFVSADYEGIEKARRFIFWIILGLAVFLGILFGVIFGLFFDDDGIWKLALGLGIGIPLLQLPIHLIVTPRVMKRRADTALDTMIRNITTVAR